MTSIKDLERLKKRVEDLKGKVEHAKGARDEALRVLKEEFNVNSLEEATDLLSDLSAEEEQCRLAFEEAMTEYEEKWGGKLNGTC